MAAGKSRGDTPSTVEAIQMASAAILGTTTSKGHPIGSALGCGTMMEHNSSSVAMGVTPLVSEVRKSIRERDGYEILAIIWDLDRASSSEVLPEQLVVAGGRSGDVHVHVSVVSWERGLVDPFKIDEYIHTLAKKLADIEQATVNNGLDYESQGLRVLQRFNDRLNSVLFVDMVDRQFQGSWDSLHIRSADVPPDTEVMVPATPDFTTLPAAVLPQGAVESVEFSLPPAGDEESALGLLRGMVLTPTGLHTLVYRVPELGRAVIGELNVYAYSIEEADILRTVVELLQQQLASAGTPLHERGRLTSAAHTFGDTLEEVVGALADAVEAHVRSGEVLSLDGHHQALLEFMDMYPERFRGPRRPMFTSLVQQATAALKREFGTGVEIRAWRLKATLHYFVAYARRVSEYLIGRLAQYVFIHSARHLCLSVIRDFAETEESRELTPAARLVLERYTRDAYAQLNAIFDQMSYTGVSHESPASAAAHVAREMVDRVGRGSIWDMVGPQDLHELVGARLQAPADGSDSPSPEDVAAMKLLDYTVRTVSEIVPDLADSLVSTRTIDWIVQRSRENGLSPLAALERAVENAERDDAWKQEARHWLREFASCIKSSVGGGAPLSQVLIELVRFVHSKVRGHRAVDTVGRITSAYHSLKADYDQQVAAWEQRCREVEAENLRVRKHNEERERQLSDARIRHEVDTARYQSALADYEQRRAQALLRPDESPPTPPPPLSEYLAPVESEFPLRHEVPPPPRPTPSKDLRVYEHLHRVMSETIAEMESAYREMYNDLNGRLAQVAGGATDMSGTHDPDLDGFVEHVLDTMARAFSRVMPRPVAVYLRRPERPGLLRLVTYELSGDTLTVRAGNTEVG